MEKEPEVYEEFCIDNDICDRLNDLVTELKCNTSNDEELKAALLYCRDYIDEEINQVTAVIEGKAIYCASCQRTLYFNTEDLNNTTCAYCHEEAK